MTTKRRRLPPSLGDELIGRRGAHSKTRGRAEPNGRPRQKARAIEPLDKEAEEILEGIDYAIGSVGKPVEEWSEADFDQYERALLGDLVRDQEADKAVPFRARHLKDLADENPARPLIAYLRYFVTFERVTTADQNGKRKDTLVQCAPRLVQPPPPELLEYIAKRILDWWEGSGSLDEAFHLKATGRGKSTPKEILKMELEKTIAQATVQGFRHPGDTKDDEITKGAAIADAADKLGRCDETIRDLLRPPDRKPRRKKRD